MRLKLFSGFFIGFFCLAVWFPDKAFSISTELEPPEDLVATIDTTIIGQSVNLSWDKLDEANSFKIYRNDIFLTSISSKSHFYTDYDLPDDTYTYKVSAVYDSGESDPSEEVSVTIREGKYFYIGRPNSFEDVWEIVLHEGFLDTNYFSPGDELAIYDGDSAVGVKKFYFPGSTKFQFENTIPVFKEITNSQGEEYGFTPGNSFTFRFYDASQDYVFKVDYSYTFLELEEDAWIKKEFPPGNPTSYLDIRFDVHTPAPENLTGTYNDDHSISLDWDAPDVGNSILVEYRIFKNGELLNNVGPSTTEFTESNVTPEKQHKYKVQAVYEQGNSDFTNPVSVYAGPVYFDPEFPQDTAAKMTIRVTKALSMQEDLDIYDEIGVFVEENGEMHCIGAASLPHQVTEDNPVDIIVPRNNSSTSEVNGYIEGKEILYRFADDESQNFLEEVSPAYTGNPNYNYSHFSDEDTTIVELRWIPPGPQNLQGTVENDININLSWQENETIPDHITLMGFNLYRDDQKINSGLIESTTYTDGDLLVDTYDYYVQAVYQKSSSAPEVNSDDSETISVTIPFQHFAPLENDNENQMTFYVTQAEIDGVPLETYDEIGIFTADGSGEICIGAGSLHDNLTSSSPLEINVSENTGTGGKDGYHKEDSIIYRFWKHDGDAVYNTVIPSFPQEPEYEFEEFSTGDTCYVSLSFTTPPEVKYYADVQDFCKGGTEHLYVRADNFREISELHFGLLIDTNHYEVENVEAGPGFMDNMEYSNLGDTLIVDWQSNDSYNLNNGDTLLDISILTQAQGNTSLEWTEESYSVGKELQDYEFQGGDFYIDKKPEPALGITGDSDVCSGVSFSNYSVSSISGADEYTWNLTPGEAGTLSASGASCQVFWNSDFEAEATLSVAGKNHCGTGDSAYKTINISKSVTVDVSIEMVNDAQCQGDTIKIVANPENQGNNPEYNWYINDQKSYQSSDTLTGTNFSDEDEIYCVLESSQGCAENNPAESNTIVLTMDPLPEKPTKIVGNTIMCTTVPNSEYTTSGSGFSDSYQWRMNPEEAADSIKCLDDKCQQIRVEWNTEWEGTAFLWVQGVNDCGTGQYNSSPHKIIRDYCTNVSDLSENGWKLYPNPVDEILYIENEQLELIQWELISVSGKVLKNGSLNEGEASINLKPHNSGIYFLRIQSSDNVTLHKVIKK